MAIKAFIFDCGGVLLHNGDPSLFAQWEERLGLEPGRLSEILWDGEPWKLARVGQLSDWEYWLRVGAELGLSDEKEIRQLRDELRAATVVEPRVLSLVDRLRQDYLVAILSNASDSLEELLQERFGIADRFAAIVNSARLGVAKPDPAIYEEALRRLDCKPQEVVFIDDKAENVAAAASLGMHIVWFVHAAELERQLAEYLKDGRETLMAGPAPSEGSE